MDCELCGTTARKKFFCEACLTERLLIHNSSLKRLSAAHHVTLQKAAQLIEAPGGVQERRILKSKRAALILSLRFLETERARSVEQSESLKHSVSQKQRELAIRRSKLHAARSQLRGRRSALHQPSSELTFRHLEPSGQGINLPQQIASVHQHWDEVMQQLVHVREKLTVQLYSIYTITANHPMQSTSRPEAQTPSSRDQNPKSSSPGQSTPSWRILGLCLPVSTEIKSYHYEEISAATLYTSHLMRLLAMYLGIKLPFQLIMGPYLSIRAPLNSVWSKKHPTPYPLHIPTSITSTVHSSGSQVSQIAFLSGLCMLASNADYLLLTQQPQLSPRSLDPSKEQCCPLAHKSQTVVSQPQPPLLGHKPTELLRNLYSLRLTRPIGHFSHLTGSTVLMRPDDPLNPAWVDLQEVINEVLQSKPEDSVDEGWSMI